MVKGLQSDAHGNRFIFRQNNGRGYLTTLPRSGRIQLSTSCFHFFRYSRRGRLGMIEQGIILTLKCRLIIPPLSRVWARTMSESV